MTPAIPTITREQLDWLTDCWTPGSQGVRGSQGFRTWLAGSDRAHELIRLLILAEQRRFDPPI